MERIRNSIGLARRLVAAAPKRKGKRMRNKG